MKLTNLEVSAYQLRLLIDSQLLALKLKRTFTGLKELAFQVNEHTKVTMDQKYLHKAILELDQLTKPDVTITRKKAHLDALADFAGFHAFNHFQQELAKVEYWWKRDLKLADQAKSLLVVCREKQALQIRKHFAPALKQAGISVTIEQELPSDSSVSLILQLVSVNELSAFEITENSTEGSPQLLPLFSNLLLAEAKTKAPVLSADNFLEVDPILPVVFPYAIDLFAEKQSDSDITETPSTQQIINGSGQIIGKIEGKYISMNDQHFNNPS